MDTSGIKAPPGGFEQGGWYWNPSIGQAQRYLNGSFLAPGQTDPTPAAPVAQQSNPVLDFLKSSADAAAQKMDEYNSKVSDYDKANPFNYDQMLADETTKATQQLDPYYKQTLGDYLQGVETQKNRSLQDQKTLLTDLNTDTSYYTGRAALSLQNAIDKSRNGYADAGLYSSGQNLRTQGQMTEQSNAQTGNFLTGQANKARDINTNTQRNLQDLTTNSNQYQRDLNAEKSYNVQNTALTNVKSDAAKYAFERGQALGAPPGADPLQYDQSLYGYLQG